MKIRTQFITTMALFGVVLFLIFASIIYTSRQVAEFDRQEGIATNIERAAGELSYLSNDYLLYRESQQRDRWAAKFASFSSDLASLKSDGPELQAIIDDINSSRKRLQSVFADVASILEGASRSQDAAALQALVRLSWSRLAVQNQSLFFDTSRLSEMLRDRKDNLKQRNILLIFILLGLFGAYFVIIYLTVNRRILKSISELRAGAKVIGSGNLDFAIDFKRNDEIGELSRAFNEMAADLKGVTASKADLEREIKERRRAEKDLQHSLEEQQKVMDLAPVAILVSHDPSCRHIIGNRMANHFYEAHEGDNISANPPPGERTSFRRFFRDGRELNPTELPMREAVATGKDVLDVEVEAQMPSGKRLIMRGSATPLHGPDGRVRGCIAAFMDITRRKQVEEEIRLLNQRLQCHVQELEAANRELEAFSYSVSHDLRAPLRHITGFAELLRTRSQGNLDEKSKHYLEVISKGTTEMGRLIDDLLSFARTGRVEMRKVRIDVGELVKETIRDLGFEVRERNVAWDIGPLNGVSGDPGLLKCVWTNLIANALKFTRNREKALIAIDASDGGSEWVFRVKDNGIGFDMQYGDKLFGLFQRLHVKEEFEGSGVGLANVQRIIQRHGGRVWAEGIPGAGATFYFSLPKDEEG